MISLKEVLRLGFLGGCRFRGWHRAESFSAAAAAAVAASNQMLELQQRFPGLSSTVGKMQWKLGPCHSPKPLRQPGETDHGIEGHSTVVLLDQAVPSSPYEKCVEQILELQGPVTSACHESTPKGWMFPKFSDSDSQQSTREHANGRDCPCETKQEDADQGFKASGGEDRKLGNEGNMYMNGGHVVKCAGASNPKEVISLTSKPCEKNMRCQLLGRPVRSYGSSCTTKPSREGLSEVKQQSWRPGNVYSLNRRISILMETGYLEEAYALYEQILPAGCKPNSYTYLHLLKGFCEAGEFEEAQQLFRGIIAAEGLPRDGSEEILYNVMVHGLGTAGFVNEALNLMEEMTKRGCSPDIYTYNSIIHSLGKAGKVKDAFSVFESMAGKGCTPDVVTYNSLIFSLGKAGRVMEAYALYEGMIERGCLPDLFTFNTLLPILGKSGEVALAINLYTFMNLVGCHPDVYTYTSLVRSLCWAGRVDEALLLSVEMTEKGCAPNTVTFNSWLDGLCKGGRVVEAHLLYQKMLVLGYVPDIITYCILIDAFCNTGQFLDDSFSLLKELLKITAILDSRTLEIVYQSFKKVGMLKQAKRIARNARAKRPHLTGLTFASARSACNTLPRTGVRLSDV